MNKVILSNEIPEITENLKVFGYEAINTVPVKEFLPFEQKHADMQCLKIKDTYFVLKNCQTLANKLKNEGLNVIETASYATGKYPGNVLLNCIYIGNKLYCNETAVDIRVKEFCITEDIEIINVNQGYAKCSTAIIDDKFITADKGIFSSLSQNGVGGILINHGEIQLTGVEYGFIGGCSFSDDNNVYFTGDITQHCDYEKIRELCYTMSKNIICLTNKKLYDIGGFVVI